MKIKFSLGESINEQELVAIRIEEGAYNGTVFHIKKISAVDETTESCTIDIGVELLIRDGEVTSDIDETFNTIATKVVAAVIKQSSSSKVIVEDPL